LVEVLFGLVNDERPVICIIKREIEQQQDDAALPGDSLRMSMPS
jgi:hypothetical protein